ncbi:MAG: hypothetical protein FJW40_11855 [Acidobacteria bacterium]|nr:hypothetical protein [Acidobacteriota bacterium]
MATIPNTPLPTYESWQPEGRNVRIEYTPEVMDEIRMHVVTWFRKMGRGGLEVGGVLFGLRVQGRVRILAWRPIECEHARGPGFLLSPADESKLAATLAHEPGQGDLKGLDVVGWFHSHTRSGIHLSQEDLDLHNLYFPQDWQIALVLHPSNAAPTRAGFFYREPGGAIQAAQSVLEFELKPLKPAKPRPGDAAEPQAPQEAPAANTSTPAGAPATVAATEESPAPAVEPIREAPPARGTNWWKPVVAFFAPIVLVAGLLAVPEIRENAARGLTAILPVPPAVEQLQRDVRSLNEQLRLERDRTTRLEEEIRRLAEQPTAPAK